MSIKSSLFNTLSAAAAFFLLSACSNDKEIIKAYDSGNFSLAEKLCNQRIEKNDPKCLYLLGRMNLEGNTAVMDIEKSGKMLKQAALSGHRRAQLLYGLYAYRGEFEGDNFAEGLSFIRAAADSGLPEAQLWYYNILKTKKEDSGMENNFSEEEEKEMIKNLEKAAAGGNTDAMISLAISYCVPDALKTECEEKGLPVLIKAAQSGSVIALRSLGIVYYSRNEFDKSVDPLKQAALLGDGESSFYLGRIYLAGEAYEEGYKWIKSASENGYKNADGQLAVFLEPGTEKIKEEGDKRYENLVKTIKYNIMQKESKDAARNIKKDFNDDL